MLLRGDLKTEKGVEVVRVVFCSRVRYRPAIPCADVKCKMQHPVLEALMQDARYCVKSSHARWCLQSSESCVSYIYTTHQTSHTYTCCRSVARCFLPKSLRV